MPLGSAYDLEEVIALSYQIFPKPRIRSLAGITSSRIPCLTQRQTGAPFDESTSKPRWRSRFSRSWYSAAVPISARVSTSRVARTGGAAGSVMSNDVAHPPRNTSSSHIGPSARAAISMISRFGFCALTILAELLFEFLHRRLPFSCAASSQPIRNDQKFVEFRIAPGRLGRRFVYRCKRLTPHITGWVRPHYRLIAVEERRREWRRACQRSHPSAFRTSFRHKEVAHTVNQKLLEVSDVYAYSVPGFVSQI